MPHSTRFIHRPDPAHPGWHVWDMEDQARFNPEVMGAMRLRTEADGTARLRMEPRPLHANAIGTLHGAAILSLIDIALFATAYTVCQSDAAGAVTLDLDCRFIGAGDLEHPLDAVTEVLRETGRLVFMRGIVEQSGVERETRLIAAYSATIRKPSSR